MARISLHTLLLGLALVALASHCARGERVASTEYLPVIDILAAVRSPRRADQCWDAETVCAENTDAHPRRRSGNSPRRLAKQAPVINQPGPTSYASGGKQSRRCDLPDWTSIELEISDGSRTLL